MRAGKDKGRHERAGANAGDHRVVRSFTGGSQAAEQPGAKGAILAAAGQNEPRAWLWRQRIVEVRIGIDPKARSRNSRDAGDSVLRGRERHARRQLRLCGWRRWGRLPTDFSGGRRLDSGLGDPLRMRLGCCRSGQVLRQHLWRR